LYSFSKNNTRKSNLRSIKMKTRLKKIGAIAGIAFPVLQMTAQGFIQIGGAEPAFTASAPVILEFFKNRDTTFFAIGEYISTISLIVFLWFVGVLWSELWAAEGKPGWLSMVAFGSGLVTASALSTAGWRLAMFRINEGLEPQMAQLLFDLGNMNFANIWVALGGMVLAAGIIFLGSGTFPKWLGWGSIVLAAGLLLARVVWTSPVAFAPYVLYWVWMIVLGIRMFRRN
jgi:hypothetical protein